MNYEDKTNRWIAIEVAKRLGKRVSTVTEFYNGDGCVVYPHSNQINFDPCNNPSDAWGIIVENKIALDFIDGFGWTANPVFDSAIEYSCHSEPLRAAMICFLKMKDAEK